MSRLPGKSEIERRDREERRVPTISHLYLSSAFLVLFVFLATMWPLLTGRATPDLSAYPWLYLRDDKPLAASEKVGELMAVGDVMLGRGLAHEPRPELCPEPCRRVVEGPFTAVRTQADSERDELPPRRLGFACDGQTVRLCSVEACRPVNVPQTPRTGPFRTGATDLTGDGVAEQVRLEEQQVIVCRDGVEVWRGLPEWRVVDLALGDPNDDGRSELLLALWKPDAAGVPRDSTELVEVSHPFIIGYREGAYRILWGGSAVADPIHEVELGDVDGDGIQELIVLEERGDGCAVTVWRWHGWGFSLMWRSPPGRYRDLALITGGADHPPIVSVAVES
jgi:hypothetical protein